VSITGEVATAGPPDLGIVAQPRRGLIFAIVSIGLFMASMDQTIVATALLLASVYGGNQYSWASAPVISLLIGGVVLLAAFVWWETKAREPLLPLRLFRDRVFSVVSACLFIATVPE
jgi:hypothetical protein